MSQTVILKTQSELNHWRAQCNSQIHFVPTMGGLHKGHCELIKTAKEFNQTKKNVVLVSIFVNPLQFGASEDFKKYPRNLVKDSEIAFDAGAEVIWAPLENELFPQDSDLYSNIKAPTNLQKYLCGSTRKGHFDGVATIIVRFLSLIKPNVLFLGEKDWQQLIILRKVIQDLKLPVKIQGVPSHRDPDGLVTSSRNQYLSKADRIKAIALPISLKNARNIFQSEKKLNLNEMRSYLKKNDLIVEYLDTFDPESLQPKSEQKEPCLLAAAIRIGETRLIDHSFLMSKPPVVAIDGPAGAGKSTVTKAFAKKVGLIYLDTGAMYRAVTWFIKTNQINPHDENTVANALEDLQLKLELSKLGHQKVLVNNKDITNEIRSPEITSKVSILATQKAVRESLTLQQKKIGLKGGIVAEGRDLGTTVFPNAILKVFLTASPSERARRRSIDLKKQGFPVPNLIELENQIKERDQIDSTRKISPLLKAKDAKELITDGMTIEEVIESLVDLFRVKVPEEVWPSPTQVIS